MIKIKNLFFILIFSFTVFFIFPDALTLYGNYIKLVAYDNGRFNLYGRNSVNDKWTPLLYEDKIPANYFKIFSQNKEVPYGQGGLDRFSDIYIKDNKIFYSWYDKKFRVEIIFELVNINSKENADALVMDMTIKNTGIKDTSVDYYLCLDTYFGEKSNEHFVIEDKFTVTSETKVETPVNLRKISSFDKNKKLGIDFIFNFEGETSPSLVYFANWKKVEKTTGLYSPVEGKSFDYLPNSINDSAVFIEYINQMMEVNKENKYKFILNLKNNIPVNDGVKVKNKIEENKDKNDKKNILEQYGVKEISGLDIKDLLELLDKINQKLDSGLILKEDEVNVLNQILYEIKKKRNK